MFYLIIDVVQLVVIILVLKQVGVVCIGVFILYRRQWVVILNIIIIYIIFDYYYF